MDNSTNLINTEKVVISIDAMGGSGAPGSVIKAVSIVCKNYNDIFFLLYGNEEEIVSSIQKFPIPDHTYSIISTEDIIKDDEKPLSALKNGKNSSMRQAIDSVANKEAHACVSCGNTGALMVMAKLVCGSLSKIKRPAICGLFPTIKNEKAVILDMGANTECDEVNFFHFALMGNCFAKILLGRENPSIAILNIGAEQVKGRTLEQKAYEILQSTNLNFIGYVEGHDVIEGFADVIVTDGFSGNVLLKASEGAAKMFLNLLKRISSEGVLAKLCLFLLKKHLKNNIKIIDPDMNNGAMLVGIDGIVVKSHGGAKPTGIANAIESTYRLAKCDINSRILKELELLEEQGIGVNIVDKIKQTSAKIFGMNK